MYVCMYRSCACHGLLPCTPPPTCDIIRIHAYKYAYVYTQKFTHILYISLAWNTLLETITDEPNHKASTTKASIQTCLQAASPIKRDVLEGDDQDHNDSSERHVCDGVRIKRHLARLRAVQTSRKAVSTCSPVHTLVPPFLAVVRRFCGLECGG